MFEHLPVASQERIAKAKAGDPSVYVSHCGSHRTVWDHACVNGHVEIFFVKLDHAAPNKCHCGAALGAGVERLHNGEKDDSLRIAGACKHGSDHRMCDECVRKPRAFPEVDVLKDILDAFRKDGFAIKQDGSFVLVSRFGRSWRFTVPKECSEGDSTLSWAK